MGARRSLTVTDIGVRRRVQRLFRADIDESIQWTDLDRVVLVNGRLGELVFLLLDKHDQGVAMSSAEADASGLHARLKGLAGFDAEAGLRVLSGQSNRVIVWQRAEVS